MPDFLAQNYEFSAFQKKVKLEPSFARRVICFAKKVAARIFPAAIIKQFYLLRGNFYDTIVLCENDFGIVCQCNGFQIRKQFLPLL